MVSSITLIMEVYCNEHREEFCPPDLDKLDNVRAGAAFLTDLEEDDNIAGAWAWLIRRMMITEDMIKVHDGSMTLMPYTAIQLFVIVITGWSVLTGQGLISTEGAAPEYLTKLRWTRKC